MVYRACMLLLLLLAAATGCCTAAASSSSSSSSSSSQQPAASSSSSSSYNTAASSSSYSSISDERYIDLQLCTHMCTHNFQNVAFVRARAPLIQLYLSIPYAQLCVYTHI